MPETIETLSMLIGKPVISAVLVRGWFRILDDTQVKTKAKAKRAPASAAGDSDESEYSPSSSSESDSASDIEVRLHGT